MLPLHGFKMPTWPQAVLNSVINHQHVPVRVNGPVGGESILSENYDQLLLVAGGVGVSLNPAMPAPRGGS